MPRLPHRPAGHHPAEPPRRAVADAPDAPRPRGAPPPGDPGPPITEGFEMRGADPPALDSVLRRTWANMAVFRAFADEVRPEYRAFTTALDQLRVQLDIIAADIDGLRPLTLTPALVDEARALIAEARTLRTNLGGADGLDRVATTVAR